MPEAVDSTWDSTELCQTLSASLSWNTKPAQPRSWSIILKRNYWMRLLSTRMLSPSQQNDFTDWWTGSLADRRVSRSASQGNNSAQTIPETSGLSLSEWWNRFSQEAASSRTSPQESLFGTSTSKSSQDFDIWATKLRAAYSQRLKLARHTTGSESSFWPTATTDMTSERSSKYAQGGTPLTVATQNWPTPDVNSSTYSNGERGQNLRESAAMWATPSANEDAAGTVKGKMQYMLSHQAQEATGVTSQNDSGQRLNPAFVTWLMGWPDGWLRFHALKNSESSETE